MKTQCTRLYAKIRIITHISFMFLRYHSQQTSSL